MLPKLGDLLQVKNPSKIISKINTAIPLPCLPQVLVKLNRLCNSDAPSLEHLTRLVTMDPTLALKFLRLETVIDPSKSAYEIIEGAVARQGPGGIKNVALYGLSNPLSNPLLWKTDASFNAFWHHSLHCAVLARTLSQRLLPESADDAYIAGLIHDIGKLLLWANFKKDYEPLFKKSIRADSALPAENDSIGTNHCEAGWNFVRSLKIHPFIADSILYHHFPAKEVAKAFPLVKIIYAANTLCYQKESARFLELMAALELDLDSDQLDRIVDETNLQVDGLLKDVELTVDSLLESPVPPKGERESSLYSIFGEFRELSVRHLTLESPADGSDQADMQGQLIRSLKMLFDIDTAFFFAYDRERNLLVGKPSSVDSADAHIGQVRLPVVPEGSLPARALTQQKIFDSFGYLSNDLVSIADEQVIHLLDTEGMLCLPLFSRQKWIGVICAGIAEPQFPLLWEQLKLLTLFAEQAATLLERALPPDIQPKHPDSSEEVIDTVGDDAIRRVIHEVNNPLSIVKNYLNVLSSKIGENSGVNDEITLIREEIRRIPGIIAQLSKSQYKDDADDDPVDINSIIHDLSKLLTRSVFENAKINLTFSPEPRLPVIRGKKSNLIQVFINLLKNSVEAMPAGGNIYITTAFEKNNTGKDSGRIVVVIRDDGPGMPDKVLSRLFIPGTSSKGPEHFGLGLSISKDIITRHKGRMHCESHKDKGTTFRITLPVSNQMIQHNDEGNK